MRNEARPNSAEIEVKPWMELSTVFCNESLQRLMVSGRSCPVTRASVGQEIPILPSHRNTTTHPVSAMSHRSPTNLHNLTLHHPYL